MSTYNIKEVASILNMTQKAVRRIVASGEIESIKKGTRYIINKHALEDYQNRFKTNFTATRQTSLSEKQGTCEWRETPSAHTEYKKNPKSTSASL